MSNSILDRIEKTLTKLSTEHEVKMEGVFYGASVLLRFRAYA